MKGGKREEGCVSSGFYGWQGLLAGVKGKEEEDREKISVPLGLADMKGKGECEKRN